MEFVNLMSLSIYLFIELVYDIDSVKGGINNLIIISYFTVITFVLLNIYFEYFWVLRLYLLKKKKLRISFAATQKS